MPDETVHQAGSHGHLTPDANPVAEDVEHCLAELAKLRRTVEYQLPDGQRRRMLVPITFAEAALTDLADRLDDAWVGEFGWKGPAWVQPHNHEDDDDEVARLAEVDRLHPPARCADCGDVLNAEDMPEHQQQMHGADR